MRWLVTRELNGTHYMLDEYDVFVFAWVAAAIHYARTGKVTEVSERRSGNVYHAPCRRFPGTKTGLKRSHRL